MRLRASFVPFAQRESVNAYIDKALDHISSEFDVIQADIPERLQGLYGIQAKRFSLEDLQEEALWIVSLLKEKNVTDANLLVFQVMEALDLMKNQDFEIMYISLYKSNILSALSLSDLWTIQEQDLKWGQIINLKQELLEQINGLRCTRTCEEIARLINEATDLNTLQNISEYIRFKKTCLLNVDLTQFGLDISGPTQNMLLTLGFDFFLSPQDFASNLERNDRACVPPQIFNKPFQYFLERREGLKEVKAQSSEAWKNDMIFFDVISFLKAYELFQHPSVRKQASKIYLQKVRINTRPQTSCLSMKKSVLDIYSPGFPVKRIKNRPVSQISADEIGLQLKKYTIEGEIDLDFHTCDDPQIFDPKYSKLEQDGMFRYLVSHFTSPVDNEVESMWNKIRTKCIIYLLHNFMYQHLEKNLATEITSNSGTTVFAEPHLTERSVIQLCTEKLRYIACNGPCLSSKKYARVMSVILTQETQPKILCVLVDSDGNLQDLCQELDFSPFKMIGSQTIDIIKPWKEVELRILASFIHWTDPEIIVLGSFEISRRTFRAIVRECMTEKRSKELIPNILYSSTEIPERFLQASRKWIWNQLETGVSPRQHVALSLGRMQQNAFAEITKLWSETDDNQLVEIKFHDLQPYVDRRKLMDEYRKLLIEIANSVGINLNDILACNHRAAPLQFISGLGPLKAQYFLSVAKLYEKTSFGKREELLKWRKYCFQPKVFHNAIGFIIVCPPKMKGLYNIARKMQKDIFGPLNGTTVFEMVKQHPERLKNLDLEDFAVQLGNSRGWTNMKPLLDLIIRELTIPFADMRRTFTESSPEILFPSMKQRKFTVGSLIQGVVFEVQSDFMRIRLEGNIESIIGKDDVYDKALFADLAKDFYNSQVITARITKVEYQNLQLDLPSLVKIWLTLKPSALNDHKEYIREIHPSLDGYNQIEPYFDYPACISNRKNGVQSFRTFPTREAIDKLHSDELNTEYATPRKSNGRIYLGGSCLKSQKRVKVCRMANLQNDLSTEETRSFMKDSDDGKPRRKLFD